MVVHGACGLLCGLVLSLFLQTFGWGGCMGVTWGVPYTYCTSTLWELSGPLWFQQRALAPPGTDLGLLKVRQEAAINTTRKQPGKACLAHAQRHLTNVLATRNEDVERIELHFVIVLAALQNIEIRPTIYPKQHGLAVDHKGPAAVAQGRLDDERILVTPIMAVAGEQAHASALALNDQPIATYFTSCSHSGRS